MADGASVFFFSLFAGSVSFGAENTATNTRSEIGNPKGQNKNKKKEKGQLHWPVDVSG